MSLQNLLDPDSKRTLRGTLERVVFHNEENGYTVLRMRVQSKADPITVVGSMPSPQPGIGTDRHRRLGDRQPFRAPVQNGVLRNAAPGQS
jgi:hypothetical protein